MARTQFSSSLAILGGFGCEQRLLVPWGSLSPQSPADNYERVPSKKEKTERNGTDASGEQDRSIDWQRRWVAALRVSLQRQRAAVVGIRAVQLGGSRNLERSLAVENGEGHRRQSGGLANKRDDKKDAKRRKRKRRSYGFGSDGALSATGILSYGCQVTGGIRQRQRQDPPGRGSMPRRSTWGACSCAPPTQRSCC